MALAVAALCGSAPGSRPQEDLNCGPTRVAHDLGKRVLKAPRQGPTFRATVLSTPLLPFAAACASSRARISHCPASASTRQCLADGASEVPFSEPFGTLLRVSQNQQRSEQEYVSTSLCLYVSTSISISVAVWTSISLYHSLHLHTYSAYPVRTEAYGGDARAPATSDAPMRMRACMHALPHISLSPFYKSP